MCTIPKENIAHALSQYAIVPDVQVELRTTHSLLEITSAFNLVRKGRGCPKILAPSECVKLSRLGYLYLRLYN